EGDPVGLDHREQGAGRELALRREIAHQGQGPQLPTAGMSCGTGGAERPSAIEAPMTTAITSPSLTARWRNRILSPSRRRCRAPITARTVSPSALASTTLPYPAGGRSDHPDRPRPARVS